MAKKFEVIVNKAWCKGCGICVGVCPKKVLFLNERMKATPTTPESCIGCRQCDYSCPDLAITIREDEANG